MNTMRCARHGMAWWALCLLAVIPLLGCGSTPVAPRTITLAGIVVDGRVAGAEQPGLVRVERAGRWFDAHADMVLQLGDQVSTGPNATALIRYPSGSELFVRPNTRGRIGSFSEMVGEVFAKIRGAFAIQTSFVKAGAEGTAYSVRATPGGDYAVVVLDGTVQLSSLNQAWPAVALGAGSMSAGRPHVPPQPMRASLQELERTRAWVEQVERLLPPPRHHASAGTALAVAGLVAILVASQAGGGDDIGAPAGLAPGSASAQQPAVLRSCSAITLSWQPVRGAHDYLVSVERPSSPERSTAAAPSATTQPTSSTTLALPRGAYGLYRWHVQARNDRGKTGPPSATLHFYCPG